MQEFKQLKVNTRILIINSITTRNAYGKNFFCSKVFAKPLKRRMENLFYMSKENGLLDALVLSAVQL